MSLRDAMLQAGLIDKKKKRQADRQSKRSRRKKQGNRQRRSEAEAQAAAAREAAREAELQRQIAERQARAERSLEDARRLQARHLLQAHRIDANFGPVRFFHRAVAGPALLRMDLPWTVARGLREGRLVIGALVGYGEPEYVIVPAGVAERVRVPELLVFWNREGCPDEPDLKLLPEYFEQPAAGRQERS